jgi:hypothetical protein
VALKIALATAPPVGGRAGSPRPVGSIPLSTKCASISGIFFHANEAVLVEIILFGYAIFKTEFAIHGRAVAIGNATHYLLQGAALVYHFPQSATAMIFFTCGVFPFSTTSQTCAT